MCTSSSNDVPGCGSTGTISIDEGYFFGTKRKVLQQDHKLTTADLSQICDGRNWETFRDVENKKKTVPIIAPPATVEENEEKPSEESSNDDNYLPTLKESNSEQPEKKPAFYNPISSSNKNNRRSSSFDLRQADENRENDNEEKSQPRKSRSRSGSGRRRHSNEDEVSAPLPSEKQSRRLSLDTGGNPHAAAAPSPPRVAVRNLSEPMHRCSTTNLKVSGIMRPARYSSNNLAAMAEAPTPPKIRGLSNSSSPGVRKKGNYLSVSNRERRPRRSTSYKPSPGAKVSPSGSTLTSSVTTNSMDNVRNLNNDASNNSEMKQNESFQEMSNHWVASGVNFSKSMEVYLFKT
mmetsp:Transcript_39169/g.81934  ORF Transcript_39169/g.81934 Transcript_39169/m.81934 type:complete len:348 (-) Transcript_39169:54-1097(-)